MPTVVDASDYERLYRRTRGIKGEIRRDFRKHLREAAKIGQRAARERIREWPGGGGGYTHLGHGRHLRGLKSRGLRSTLAANIGVRVDRRGVRIVQTTRGLTGRNANRLPKDINKGGWKHPVYGHGSVFQRGLKGYFDKSIDDKREEMLQQAAKVLEDITERLT